MAACRILLPIAVCALLSLADGRKNRGPKSPSWGLQVDPSSFISSHTITEISEKTYDMMESAKECFPLPEFIVAALLGRIKLNFFYGPSTSDRIIMPLAEASRLVNYVRWARDRPMAVYTFGWLNTPTNSYSKQLINAYDINGRYNLVVVDWSQAGTFLEYTLAATMVPRVGKAVAKALQQMLDAGAKLDHLVGHSLGAQVSGHIGRNLNKRPPLVVGLDPAGPLFYSTMFQCQDPIRAIDGEYVVALHTDWNRLGSNELTGPADFMPAGGFRLQPGCGPLNLDFYGPACSHNRAISLWADAIHNGDSIYGRQCTSYESYLDKLCENKASSKLAAPNRKLEGVFYFTTNEKSPYGRGIGGA